MGKVSRPFELLKVIRDGILQYDLQLGFIGSVPRYYYRRFIDGLHKLEFIERDRCGKITSTDKLEHLLSTLDISLSQLSDYSYTSIVSTPVFGLPSEPATKADIFVLMPFLEAFRPVYDDHIKNVAKELNCTVARADDFFSADSVINDIWNAINAAQIIIADCTGKNPNVFYEMGIAHTLGKTVILCTQSLQDIPFDVRHLRAIRYEFTPRGMQEFEKTLLATIKHEIRRPKSLESPLLMDDQEREELLVLLPQFCHC